MTRKEELNEVFEAAIKNEDDYIAIAVETHGNPEWEIIINPIENYEQKLAYYQNAYNDDLVLNTYDGIRIASMCSFNGSVDLETVNEILMDYEFL